MNSPLSRGDIVVAVPPFVLACGSGNVGQAGSRRSNLARSSLNRSTKSSVFQIAAPWSPSALRRGASRFNPANANYRRTRPCSAPATMFPSVPHSKRPRQSSRPNDPPFRCEAFAVPLTTAKVHH